ncbi:CDP-diacylglycerol--glycerol-3-phosphate 3-phosphatidyltransferase [Oleidesulfovibrio sp.]|uniref:CDP-diacylglycerol--glycerol-3-phosphate 3-phosphatidyltransferase n=1 Tax=Oleidesulfovibrio sp. TaxID=2909707 RepID=UPI003A862F86
MFTLANKITLFRILIVPLIVLLLYFPGRITCLLAMIGFMLASISDMLDGHIARKSNTVTSFGKFLDPLADKLLISSVLVMLSALGWVPAWVVIVIICRELIVTGLRAIAADEGVVIAADKFGKMKTILQMLALTPLLLHYPWFGFDPNPIGQILLYMALILTVFSGGNYLYAFYKNWRAGDSV